MIGLFRKQTNPFDILNKELRRCHKQLSNSDSSQDAAVWLNRIKDLHEILREHVQNISVENASLNKKMDEVKQMIKESMEFGA